MAKKSQEARHYAANINALAQLVRTFPAARSGFEMKSENPQGTGVWFRLHHGMSMRSYGEKITVTLTPDAAGTQVDILSECGLPTQLVDYGKNAENVRIIFQYIEACLASATQPQAAPAARGTAQPQQAPSAASQPRPQAEARFCAKCGTPRMPGANFCAKCGSRF